MLKSPCNVQCSFSQKFLFFFLISSYLHLFCWFKSSTANASLLTHNIPTSDCSLALVDRASVAERPPVKPQHHRHNLPCCKAHPQAMDRGIGGTVLPLKHGRFHHSRISWIYGSGWEYSPLETMLFAPHVLGFL